MKKIFTAVLLTAMAGALALSACTKDEPDYSYNSGGSGSGSGGGGGGTQTRPSAYFLVDGGIYITTNTTVNFLNSSSNATSYRWNFGDGTSSTMYEPTHRYSTPGTKTVTLYAYNNNNDMDSYSRDVRVDAYSAYISRIVVTDWPSRNNGNVWDQFATASTKHPDIFFKISASGTVLFTSQVIDDCIHPDDGGTTSPSFTVGQTFVPMSYTITFYDEDSLENVEMGGGTFNLVELGRSTNHGSVLSLTGGGFSFKIYVTWS